MNPSGITSAVLYTGTISSVATIWKAANESEKVYIIKSYPDDTNITKLHFSEVKRNTVVLPNVKWSDANNNPLSIEYNNQQSAISNQQSAISNQQSAIQLSINNAYLKAFLVELSLLTNKINATRLYLPFSKEELLDSSPEKFFQLFASLTEYINKKLGNYATGADSIKLMDDSMFNIESPYLGKSLSAAVRDCSRHIPAWKSLAATNENVDSDIRIKAFADAELPDPSMIRSWHDKAVKEVPATANYDSFRKFIATQAMNGKYHTLSQIIELCLAFSLKDAPGLHVDA